MWFFRKKPSAAEESSKHLAIEVALADEREKEIDLTIQRMQAEKEVEVRKRAADLKKFNQLIDKHGVAGLLYAIQGGDLDGHS